MDSFLIQLDDYLSVCELQNTELNDHRNAKREQIVDKDYINQIVSHSTTFLHNPYHKQIIHIWFLPSVSRSRLNALF